MDHPEGGDKSAVRAASDVEGGCSADEDSEVRALSEKNGGERTAEVFCLLPTPVEQNVAEQLRLLDDEWFAAVIVVNQQGQAPRACGAPFNPSVEQDSPIGVR
jgi:hypothetical protein